MDNSRIEAINNLADRLIGQDQTDTETIRTKKDDLNQQWVFHRYNYNCDVTHIWYDVIVTGGRMCRAHLLSIAPNWRQLSKFMRSTAIVTT